MKKQLNLITLALMVALCATASFAQMTGTVKGKVTDQAGAPMVDATVVYQSTDSGRKYEVKTDKRGEYFRMGVQPGTYNIQLLKDGQMIFHFNNVPVKIAAENKQDIDLKKEASAVQAANPEEKKRMEAAQKANEKIKGLNAKLAQADAAAKAGNCAEAVQIMTEATTADPTRDLLWARLGEFQTCDKHYPEAVESYKKAIAIAPNRGEYHNNLGQALLKDNKIEEAIAEYNTAAQVDPAGAGTYFFNLGAVLTNKGKLDEAIAAFDKSIAADPNKADAYYQKGVNMLGKATLDKNGAMVAPPGTAEMFNKYLELAPEGPYAQGSKDLLASIGAKVQTSFGERKATKKK